MKHITPAQCRAARALLNWSQPELARRCGVHVQTISNFEKESSSPSKTTLQKISTVLLINGVALLDDDGVMRHKQTVQQYQGGDGFRLFMDDIYETMRNGGRDLFLLNANPDLWIKWLGEEWYYNTHSTRMESLLPHIRGRILVKRGNYNFIGRRFAEYRWVHESLWDSNSFYSYGDKLGFMDFENNDIQIFVLHHKKFAETFRFLFNMLWEQHSIIPDTPDYKPKTK